MRLALLGDDRLGGREALAVEREAERPVVEDHRVVQVDFGLIGVRIGRR